MATAETDTSLRHRQPLYSPPDVVDVKAYISSYLLSVSVPGSSILLYPVVAECCPLDIIIIIFIIIIHTTCHHLHLGGTPLHLPTNSWQCPRRAIRARNEWQLQPHGLGLATTIIAADTRTSQHMASTY